MGIIKSITSIAVLLKGEDAKIYASGYASKKQITVARSAVPTDFSNTPCVSLSVKKYPKFASVKLPSKSVQAKYTMIASGTTTNSTHKSAYGKAK
jgi:hypothetical protein